MSTLEAFVCTMYGKASATCVNKVRYDKVRQSVRVGKASFQTQTVLTWHRCHRANKFFTSTSKELTMKLCCREPLQFNFLIFLNQKNMDGEAPVMLAAISDRGEELALLAADLRVDLDTTDKEGRSLEEVTRWLFLLNSCWSPCYCSQVPRPTCFMAVEEPDYSYSYSSIKS